MQKLLDISSTFKPRPWAVHMRNNRKLADLYLQLYHNTGLDVYQAKYMRLKGCSNIIQFKEIDPLNKFLHLVFFCRVRLCPVCQWRKSLFIFQQFLRVSSHALSQIPGLRFIFVTLTCKNVCLGSLHLQVNILFSSFSRLMSLRQYKGSVLGSFKTFEITYNSQDNTYHPHFHLILCVRPSYFNSLHYINHAAWVSMWRKSLQVSYDPLVNVKVIRNSISHLSDLFFDKGINPLSRAAAELSKYSVKINDCILNNSDPLNALRTFDTLLHNRRFISYTGFLKECYRHISETDSDDADLIHNTDSISQVGVLKKYVWKDDFLNYFAV